MKNIPSCLNELSATEMLQISGGALGISLDSLSDNVISDYIETVSTWGLLALRVVNGDPRRTTENSLKLVATISSDILKRV